MPVIVQRSAKILKIRVRPGRRAGNRQPLPRHAPHRQPLASAASGISPRSTATGRITVRGGRRRRWTCWRWTSWGWTHTDRTHAASTMIGEVRRRPGGSGHAGGLHRRGRDHHRGHLRTLSFAAGLPDAHAPGPRLHSGGLRPHGPEDARRRGSARCMVAFSSQSQMARPRAKHSPQCFRSFSVDPTTVA